jgi:hypothetical protein
MPIETMDLPRNVPWKLIAASPDMLDTKFCNKAFPFPWRSSMAISAFEPQADRLPSELCGDRITYLKITCSITGYQPSKDDTSQGLVSFPEVPTEELNRVLGEYFACYGVLLNVAVFPKTKFETYLEEFASVDFSRFKNTELPNPFQANDIVFTAEGQPANRTVDRYPTGGDGAQELDLFKKCDIAFPCAFEVRAVIAYFGTDRITVYAYKGDQVVAQQAGRQADGPLYTFSVSHEGGIDHIVCVAPDNQASLLKVSLCARLARPVDAPIESLPRIIDFEPKMRDLYQAASESGEVLTASRSAVQTDKSYTHSESTQTGVSLAANLGGTVGPISYGGNAGLSHSWGETDVDSSTTQTDASRDRQEKFSTTTNLNQMYNLLTGYHPGTNRAVFLMLPRPHTLQPTDRRSFIQGVRIIEGVQDFFLIVARPKALEELCIEAFLETAHFPEHVEVQEPPLEYERKTKDFDHGPITAQHPGWLGSRNEARIDGVYAGFEDEAEGWYFDPTQGVAGRGGIEEVMKFSDDNADGPDTGGGLYGDLPRMEQYFFSAHTPDKVSISGLIRSGVSFDVVFHRKYRVHLRRQKQSTSEPRVDISALLITSRKLCACFKPVRNCLQLLNSSSLAPGSGNFESIVAEMHLKLPGGLLTREAGSHGRLPLVKELLRTIQTALSTNWRLPCRMPFGEVGFLDSDYFKDSMLGRISKAALARPLREIPGLAQQVVDVFGENGSVQDVLKLDLPELIAKTGISPRQAIVTRRAVLGVKRRINIIPLADIRIPVARTRRKGKRR